MTISRLFLGQMAAFLLIVLVAIPAGAQEVEKQGPEAITREKVGPYRPEQSADLSKFDRLIVEGTNRFRKEQKLPPLKPDEKLSKAAADFAQFMAQNDLYGHEADTKTPAERVRATGYEYCLVAENIAYQFRAAGFKTPDLEKELLEGWKKSPPHRKNLLDPDVLEMGVGVAQSKTTGVFYAVQVFARPKSAAIQFTIVNQTPWLVEYKIGDRPSSLPSRYTGRHTTCRAETIQLTGTDAANSKKLALPGPVTPKHADRLVIETDDDRFVIKRETPRRIE